jgi:membrane protein DedA with SNARE-associated domain
MFLAMCFNAAVAFLWEVVEYVSDFLFHEDFQKSLDDTMLDMIVAVIGGILVMLFYIYRKKNEKKATKK